MLSFTRKCLGIAFLFFCCAVATAVKFGSAAQARDAKLPLEPAVRVTNVGSKVFKPASPASSFAFIDSVTELFGLQTSVAAFSLNTDLDEYDDDDSPANVYVPNTFADPIITTLNNATGAINGGATISLRSALMAADNLGGTHTVNLSTGTYNLSKAPNSQITIGNTPQNITINGNGPANTIINMVNDANRDRILLINPVATTNSPVISISGITFQNAYLTSDAFGGGAVYSGGGTAESLTDVV